MSASAEGHAAAAEFTAAPRVKAQPALECEVREVMNPGVVSLADDASVAQAAGALRTHRVHGVLILGASNGTPLGWVTARGLLDWLGRERSLTSARDAITESVTTIEPGALVRDAVQELSVPGVNRLLVRRAPHLLPEGVVTAFDLAVVASVVRT